MIVGYFADARPFRDPVDPPDPSPEGRRKKREHVTAGGAAPLHSLRTLLDAKGSVARVTLRVGKDSTFDRDATPTPWQAQVFEAAARAIA